MSSTLRSVEARRWSGRRPRRPRGAALLSSLFALLLITLLGLSLTALGTVGLILANNDREITEAFFLADSGLTHAYALLSTLPAGSFDPLLKSGNGSACDGDELSNALPAALTPLNASDLIRPASQKGREFVPGGFYSVLVCDDHEEEKRRATLPDNDPNRDANGRILVRSVGTGRNGATATLEMLVGVVPLPAVLVDGNLRLNGNPAVFGPAGAVHSNGNLEIAGVPCAEEYFSATGTVGDSSGNWPNAKTGRGCANNPPDGEDDPADLRPGESRVPVPQISPADYRLQANFFLGNDGVIRDRNGVDITLLVPDWSWDPGNRRWVAGNKIVGGTYYAEGNIEITGNPGQSNPKEPPLPLTLLAEGWINVSGNPRTTPALVSGTLAVSMLAGTDLRLSGNPSTTYRGLHYARHQIDFSGNPALNGQVIAANLADTGTPQNLVERKQGGFIEVSGNPSIYYDGFGLTSGLTRLSWRECRGPNPANPCQ